MIGRLFDTFFEGPRRVLPDYRLIIGRIIENLKKVESKNGPHFVTVIFVVEKDAQVFLGLKF